MKYISIDTNNYIYCSYLTRPDHTPETLESLKGILSENDDIKLLIPEVVELEFYKVLSNKYDNINKDIQKFIRDINKVIPDYLEDEKSSIIDEANRFLSKRSESKKAALEIFEEIIKFDNVIRIPLNSDIILNCYLSN